MTKLLKFLNSIFFRLTFLNRSVGIGLSLSLSLSLVLLLPNLSWGKNLRALPGAPAGNFSGGIYDGPDACPSNAAKWTGPQYDRIQDYESEYGSFVAHPGWPLLRTDDLRQTGHFINGKHPGNDISVKCGSPVFADDNAQVVFAGVGKPFTGYGNVVVTCYLSVTNSGQCTVYGHLSSIPENLKRGQFISKGTRIGSVGNTGKVTGRTGVHLHYEIRTLGQCQVQESSRGTQYQEARNCQYKVENAPPVDPENYLSSPEFPEEVNRNYPRDSARSSRQRKYSGLR